MFTASVGATGFSEVRDKELQAPPLLWAEVRSALHEAAWRGALSQQDARAGLENLESSPIRTRAPAQLGRRAWEIADELGWAKMYDAEYLALAQLLGCPLATLDRGMRTAAQRLGITLVSL